MPEVEEFRELGRVAIFDSSLFPVMIRAFWAVYKKHAHALKMHLCFSLNTLLLVCFLITNGKRDDRKGLRELLEGGVTYIADRGYRDRHRQVYRRIGFRTRQKLFILQQQLFMLRQEDHQQLRKEQGKKQASTSTVFNSTEDFVAAMEKNSKLF